MRLPTQDRPRWYPKDTTMAYGILVYAESEPDTWTAPAMAADMQTHVGGIYTNIRNLRTGGLIMPGTGGRHQTINATPEGLALVNRRLNQ